MFALFAVLVACAAAAPTQTVLFLPLDERFTTRDAFLNLAKVTPFKIVTPDPSLLPLLKQPAPLDELLAWVDENIVNCDAAIISSEMFLYGGLIASRSSNDTTDTVINRLNKLNGYVSANPLLKLYLSSVVMRIPAYNEDVEEPWYWGIYGQDLYTYSYFMDEYNVTGNMTCFELAETAVDKVPPQIVSEFIWRRARNFNVSVAMLQDLHAMPSLYQHLYITLDDNALYGFNIAESLRLKQLVSSLGLQDTVMIYPGADEVGLTLLSQFAVDVTQTAPTLQLVFRNASTINLVPNYEGQPMIDTLLDQIAAAGGIATNSSSASAVLLVNNFNHFPQYEAPNQPLTGRSIADYTMFDSYLCPFNAKTTVVGFADNRYSNGGDIFLVKYMAAMAANVSCGLDMTGFAYAGWNTDGNTLGTAISNTILLVLFGKGGNRFAPTPAQSANTYFNTLRIVEDLAYQADFRQVLANYVTETPNDTVTTLNNDLEFYERFSYKLLWGATSQVASAYGVPWYLDSLYYPWNRTFEIGLYAAQWP